MRVQLMVVVVLVLIVRGVNSKSTIEPCDGHDTCSSLLLYPLPTDLKLSEVATRFQVDPVALLGANAFDMSYSDAENQIIPANYMLQIPTTCQCVGGIRKSVSTTYKVKAADTLSTIANNVFGKLITAGQIKDANRITSPDVVDIGESLVIPLPCNCFNESDNGLPAVFLSYLVQRGDSLLSIAMEYRTTVTDLMTVNSLGSSLIAPGDILAVPLSACSSNISIKSADRNLLVANGSYAITASHCLQCSCGPRDLDLYCAPAPLAASCSSMQCKNSNLMVGNVTAQQTSGGCNVTKCLYNGYVNNTILTLLENSLQPQCPAEHVLPTLTRPPSTLPAPPVEAPSPAALSPGRSASSPGRSTSGSGTSGSVEVPATGPSGQKSTAPDSLKCISLASMLILGLPHLIHFGYW